MTLRRKVIVNLATSADGYIAGPAGEMEWLIARPKPPGFYGMGAFMQSIDTKLLGRKTYEESVRLGAHFTGKERTIVFSHRPVVRDLAPGVEWVNEAPAPFMQRLREQPGKDLWLMGGGELIASFLDAGLIDEFVVSVVPVFIGDGLPLIARRRRQAELELMRSERFADGVVQNHYRVLVGAHGGRP